MKTIPEGCKGDKTMQVYVSGAQVRGEINDMKVLRPTFDEEVQLRIEGVNEITMIAISFYLIGRDIETVTESAVIEEMYPPHGLIHQMIQDLFSSQGDNS